MGATRAAFSNPIGGGTFKSMKRTLLVPTGSLLAALVLLAGCDGDPPATPPAPKKEAPPAEVKKAPLGRNVWLEVQGDRRRVVIDAQVCLREGQLEQLLCRKQTKEHEAVLSADIDARDVHKGLLILGLKPGSPVQYEPKLQPPTGPRVKITLEYQKDGKRVRVPAREWVRHLVTKKELTHDWVFAGSRFVADPQDKDKPPLYGANGGDVICLANFPDAMLDLPVDSSKENDALAYEAYTERIPPLDTRVLVILEPF